MKIFISYSTPDLSIVKQLADQLKTYGEVYHWAESKIPGKDAWDSIFNWIDQSDVVVVLITDNTVKRGISVGQEVGRAKTKHKTVIPIVDKSVSSDDLGFLNGLTYQAIDITNPLPAIEDVTKVVETYYNEDNDNKEKQKRKIFFAILASIFLWAYSE